jgi:hippurate hydrolase
MNKMSRFTRGLGACASVVLATSAGAQGKSSVASEVESVYAGSAALYHDLHLHPELSSHETQTAARLATQLKELG